MRITRGRIGGSVLFCEFSTLFLLFLDLPKIKMEKARENELTKRKTTRYLLPPIFRPHKPRTLHQLLQLHVLRPTRPMGSLQPGTRSLRATANLSPGHHERHFSALVRRRRPHESESWTRGLRARIHACGSRVCGNRMCIYGTQRARAV